MIDTISFRQEHITGDPIETKHIPGWRSSLQENKDVDQNGKTYERLTGRFNDRTTKIKLTGIGPVKRVEASLPRILFGTNERLIASQAEITAGLEQIAKVTSVFGSPTSYREYTRVDLVWHFPGTIRTFISSHRNCRHRRIRSSDCVYDDQSIQWGAKKSEVKIRMYDKRRKELQKLGGVVRVEVQLRGKALIDYLGNGRRVERLTFEQCYAAYRRVLLDFHQEPTPLGTKWHLPVVFATAAQQGWLVNGEQLFDYWARGKNPTTVRRMGKKVASLRPQFFDIDWEKLLPENEIPQVYNMEPLLGENVNVNNC